MKKIFSILFLIISLFQIQAYTYQTDTIVIRSTVLPITLSDASVSSDGGLGLYKLYGGFDSFDYSSIDYLLVDDISQEDITVYFKISQLARTKTDESITLMVEAKCLENADASYLLSQDPNLLVKTEDPVISNVTCLDMRSLTVTYFEENSNVVQFNLSYNRSLVENVNLAFFTATWKKRIGLVSGIYSSRITLSYIAN